MVEHDREAARSRREREENVIKLGLQLDWNPNRRWRLAQQMGVRHGITTGWFTRPWTAKA